MCNASWVGPIDDYCEWCHSRFVNDVDSKRNRLLFPEWLSWGDRYWACIEIDRTVWANTRGFIGDFESAWVDRLSNAFDNQLVTEDEVRQAIERWNSWQVKGQSNPLNESYET